jgi:uncharacterized membrane protein YsdA (DUF1294 family)
VNLVSIAYGTLTLVTLLVYGFDKLQAKRAARRVPERSLHALALLGGFAGAWLGMRIFRHKTQKPVFALVMLAATLVHAGAWGWWFFGRG